MDFIGNYWKAIIGVVVTVLSAVGASLTGDNVVSPNEWVNVAIAGVTAAGVFAAPNVPGAKYTKAVLAVLGAVLTALSSSIIGGVTATEAIQIVVAAAGALGVYAKANNGTVGEKVVGG